MQQSARPWTISLRGGNKETARSSQIELSPFFVVYSRRTGLCWLCREQPCKPSFKIKGAFRGSSGLPITASGYRKFFSRNGCPCPQKGKHNSVNKNRPFFGGFPVFWMPAKPSGKPDVYLDTLHALPHILNDVCGLAVQKSAQGFKVLP